MCLGQNSKLKIIHIPLAISLPFPPRNILQPCLCAKRFSWVWASDFLSWQPMIFQLRRVGCTRFHSRRCRSGVVEILIRQGMALILIALHQGLESFSIQKKQLTVSCLSITRFQIWDVRHLLTNRPSQAILHKRITTTRPREV